MKKRRLLFGLAFVFGALGLTSCYEEPDFSLTPNLTFRGIEQRTLRNAQNVAYDSLILVTRFQDGDGDLGLSETLFPEDIQGDFKVGGQNFHNMLCKAYKKKDGRFELLSLNGTPISYNGRFPRVSTIEREEPLEGDIRYSINIFEDARNPNALLRRGDTIRFDVQIMDRAGNKSPVVTTSEVILFSQQ